MVDPLRCLATDDMSYRARVVGTMAMVALLCSWTAGPLPAQGPGVHYLHQGVMPPGAIGSLQLQRGGPLPGFFQPVEIKAPPGVLISLAEEGRFTQPERTRVRAGLLIGQVYRFRVMNVPLNPGLEVFPTIEVIDRLYTPLGQERRFPIMVELTREDLQFALDGKFVTRVIYLENPRAALPLQQDPKGEPWFEVGPGRDPLAAADLLGRPVAILRMGARVPGDLFGPNMDFLFGCPPLVRYPAEVKVLPPPPEQPEQAVPPSAGAL